jgi:hypothetical protein
MLLPFSSLTLKMKDVYFSNTLTYIYRTAERKISDNLNLIDSLPTRFIHLLQILFLYIYVQCFYRTDIFNVTFNYLLLLSFIMVPKMLLISEINLQSEMHSKKTTYGYENIIKHGK